MLHVCDDVDATVIRLLDEGISPARIILFADHPEYPGYLDVQPLDNDARGAFYTEFRDWMSRHLILNGLHLLERFVDLLERSGYATVFVPSTKAILDDVWRWNEPLHIDGYDLRPFQQFSMNQALERARLGADNSDRFYFWNWSAGAGKSYCSAAGAKALLENGDVSFVIACTLSKLKENLRRNFEGAGLRAVINDHAKPAERHRRYMDGDVQVFVMNYEKLWVDETPLAEITAGQWVLYVLDEGHKLIAESGQNKARKALDRLTRGSKAIVWPMSATVVGGSPLRFRDVFSLDSYSRKNPLGTKEDFVARYADSVTTIPIKAKSGAFFSITKYDWNLAKLHEVRHRVGERTCAVRKTDPGIREQFKGIECLPEWVPMTNELDDIYKLIIDDARKARDRGESRAAHYLAMRVASINPEVFQFSHNDIAAKIWDEHPELCKASNSNKIEMLNDRLEGLQQA